MTVTQVKKDHNILILVKTYPSPSAKYIETCCTAGIDDQGKMVRIYPIPFRYLNETKRYKKWQWIKGTTHSNSEDQRPESRKIDYTAMEANIEIPSTAWEERIRWLNKCPFFDSIEAIEQARQKSNVSLGVVKVSSIVGLEFQKEDDDWTPEQKAKLLQEQQDDLFHETEVDSSKVKLLEKIPYGFYYKFTGADRNKVERIRITDWEIYQLYRNTVDSRQGNWQQKMIDKYVTEFSKRDVFLILGNMHRFQNEWLCIGVVAAPRGAQGPATGELF